MTAVKSLEKQQQGYVEEKLVEALQKISTGEIVGESKNHKDRIWIRWVYRF